MTARLVLLLRAVNVGGTGRLPMAEFRVLLGEMGLTRVATYIQSGNAVFDGEEAGLVARLQGALQARFGIAPGLFLMELPAYEAVLDENPFAVEGAEDPAKVHVHFLSAPAPGTDLAALQALATAGERFALSPRAFYLHTPQGLGTSKLAEKLGRHLKAEMTARNLRSCLAIRDLARA